MEKNETKQTKTQVFNVIILDKSGSMECIRQAAVSGFNEILNGIKKAQEKFANTQEHFVSLLTFFSRLAHFKEDVEFCAAMPSE